MIKFPSKDKNLMVEQGKLLDDTNREFIRSILPGNGKKVESTRHAIISGPQGVGKTYGTIDEANKRNVKFVMIKPGMTDAELIIKLAYNVYNLKEDEELVLIADDADDVIFSDYKTLNRWKIALADCQPELGIIPTYNHAVSMTNTVAGLRKAGRDTLADALEFFMEEDSVGVTIPFDRVRMIILCNLDIDDPKSFGSKKMWSAASPVIDRMRSDRISANKEKQWGWLAYVLGETQPFEDYPLEDDVKREMLNWVWSNWPRLRSTSYRTIEKLAEDVINYPDDYETRWEKQCKKMKEDAK